MQASGKLAFDAPQSVAIVGCGLIGSSLGLALRQAFPGMTVYGIDIDETHRREALAMNAFTDVTPTWPEASFDLAVLATPLRAACAILPDASQRAAWIADVCSAKRPICAAADALGLRERFAPTHPMAGRASGGPREASADLFRERTWLVVDGWPATAAIAPLLRRLGARVEVCPSAADHDAAMAAVSHGIHVASAAALLASDDVANRRRETWSGWTGPAWRDVTRLAASPPTEFWVDTLLANADLVDVHLARLEDRVRAVRQALQDDDRAALAPLLDEARAAHARWTSRA